MDGWNAESDAATLLTGLGLPVEMHTMLMGDLKGGEKFKVLAGAGAVRQSGHPAAGRTDEQP